MYIYVFDRKSTCNVQIASKKQDFVSTDIRVETRNTTLWSFSDEKSKEISDVDMMRYVHFHLTHDIEKNV